MSEPNKALLIARQDGDYKAVSHDEFVAGAWGLAGPSALEFDALTDGEVGAQSANGA